MVTTDAVPLASVSELAVQSIAAQVWEMLFDAPAVQVGASPRGSLALLKLSRCRAALAGRDFVTPEDIQYLAPAVLRHRIILNFDAHADGRRAAGR